MDSDALNKVIEVFEDDYITLLGICQGHYLCPKDRLGKRQGPLVAYVERDENGRNLVGEVFVHFAMAEQYPQLLHHFALKFFPKIIASLDFDVFCGATYGGLAFGLVLALVCGKKFVYPEKEIEPAPNGGRKTTLIFRRHEIQPKEKVVIVEDVSNNFSTAKALIRLIGIAGGQTTGIASFLNRSLSVDNEYVAQGGSRVPVLSLVRQPIPEYRQDDPYVAEDIEKGNIIWDPKRDWDILLEAMQADQKHSY